MSTQFRLDQAHGDAIRNIKNALASRGLIRSGEAGFQLGRENQAYGQANYDASQKWLDYIAGVQSAFASGEQQRATTLAQSASQAATRQAGLPQNQPVAGQAAHFDHTDAAGNPVYLSADGRQWNPDGSPYKAPTPAPTTFGGAPETRFIRHGRSIAV